MGILNGKSPALSRHSISTASPTVLMGFSGFSAQCLWSRCVHQYGLAAQVLPPCFVSSAAFEGAMLMWQVDPDIYKCIYIA